MSWNCALSPASTPSTLFGLFSKTCFGDTGCAAFPHTKSMKKKAEAANSRQDRTSYQIQH
jgi:hypothetical protein